MAWLRAEAATPFAEAAAHLEAGKAGLGFCGAGGEVAPFLGGRGALVLALAARPLRRLLGVTQLGLSSSTEPPFATDTKQQQLICAWQRLRR